ncbi:MAG TPA: hypothetical protein VFN29_00665 [Chiayiivirga sp.]|nr:hypothetical protein [Chiayiivirga sp.]
MAWIDAPTSDGNTSYATSFTGISLDGAKPVLIGSAVDNSTTLNDFDGVIGRLQDTSIFADGFE